jgi:hypothetical protein
MTILSISANPLLQKQQLAQQNSSLGFDDAQQIIDPRVIQRLVNNLIYLFSVSPGDNLTFILEQGHCTKNEEALKYWVINQLADEPFSQEDVLPYLIENLKRQLTLEMYS